MWWAIGIILTFVLGIAIGLFTSVAITKRFSSGTLKMNRTDPDGPYLFLELSEDIDEILRMEYITLKVDPNDYVSHE